MPAPSPTPKPPPVKGGGVYSKKGNCSADAVLLGSYYAFSSFTAHILNSGCLDMAS